MRGKIYFTKCILCTGEVGRVRRKANIEFKIGDVQAPERYF